MTHFARTASAADVLEPPIVADTSPQGVGRGELLFQSICFECHGGPDGRATGKRLAEAPAFLGEFTSANLAHPEHGVHALSDGKIARTIRSGVLHDGTLSPAMGAFSKIGDRDIAAILGYMRSRPHVSLRSDRADRAPGVFDTCRGKRAAV